MADEKAWLAECADEEARLKAAYDAEEQAHPLPEGWHKIKHEPSGLDSYVHRQSGAVCWTRPYVIPPTTDNEAHEEEHLKSIATHEIPLFPFAMILQLTELIARVETNRLTSTYVAERDEVLNSLTEGRRTTKDEGDRMEEGEVATTDDTVASSTPLQGAETHKESSADSGAAPSLVLHPHVRTHRAAPAPREVVRAATPMEKAILSVLSRAVKSKKLDAVGDVPAPARPPRRERRGKTQGVKARAASFSVEAAAQKTPITQLQEYCVNVLKTAPRYVTTTQEDPTRPYVTTVEIAGREYGRGAYINKKQSKHMAAEATLRLLCPEYAAAPSVSVGQQKESAYADPYRLDVDDEAVLSLAHTKSPTQVLQEYGNRVHAILAFKSEQVSPAQLQTTSSSKPPEHACRVEVRLDNLSTTGLATTKREAKQRAAQLMLKQLRPEARSWGELLDLEEADTAAVQGGGAASGSARRRGGDVESDTHASDMPNLRLLEQLKEEMRKRLVS